MLSRIGRLTLARREMPEIQQDPRHGVCVSLGRSSKEDAVTHTMTFHTALAGAGRLLEHAAAIVLGLLMMIVGLGLGVTMIMLPVGITVGLLGVAVLVGGLFVRIDKGAS